MCIYSKCERDSQKKPRARKGKALRVGFVAVYILAYSCEGVKLVITANKNRNVLEILRDLLLRRLS